MDLVRKSKAYFNIVLDVFETNSILLGKFQMLFDANISEKTQENLVVTPLLFAPKLLVLRIIYSSQQILADYFFLITAVSLLQLS